MEDKQKAKNERVFGIDPETGEIVEQVSAMLDEQGREVPDPVPMAPPVGYQKPFDMFEHIRTLVRSEHLRLAAMENGEETFEEADDFEVGDDYDPTSPHELDAADDAVGEEVRRRLRQDEFYRSVEAQYKRFTPKDVNDGQSTDEGREGGNQKRTAGANRVPEPLIGQNKEAGVPGRVSEGSAGNTGNG